LQVYFLFKERFRIASTVCVWVHCDSIKLLFTDVLRTQFVGMLYDFGTACLSAGHGLQQGVVLYVTSYCSEGKGPSLRSLKPTSMERCTYCLQISNDSRLLAFETLWLLKFQVIVLSDMLQVTLCLTTLRLLWVGVLTNMWLVTISWLHALCLVALSSVTLCWWNCVWYSNLWLVTPNTVTCGSWHYIGETVNDTVTSGSWHCVWRH
jgi:hypothetical protein